jgi:hypothetical protein
VAARLLPATSLFSVIGTTPSSELGTDARFHAFPRLDLGGTAAVAALDSQLGYRAALRAILRLSDDAGGLLRAEGSRRALGDEGWTGILIAAEVPVRPAARVHASVELVAADDPRDRGALWPWARVGASTSIGAHWLIAAGVGARGGPEYERELEALVRVSYRTEVVP